MNICCKTLRHYRLSYRLRRNTIAKATEITPDTIQAYEFGDRVPTRRDRSKLCGFFGVSDAILFPELQNNQPCLVLKKMIASKSYSEVSRKTRISAILLKQFEDGKKRPWPGAILRLARFFKVEEEILFPEILNIDRALFRRCTELKQARQNAGLSQSDLGIKAKLNPCYISRFENGIGPTQPWPQAIDRLSNALGIEKNQLFPHLINK